MALRTALNWLWTALAVVGLIAVLFSGVSHTVQDRNECPATWDGEHVVASEVFGVDGEVVGYWCLVEGSISRDGQQTYLSLPIGTAEGYPAWYGFVPLAIAALGFGITNALLPDRQRSQM